MLPVDQDGDSGQATLPVGIKMRDMHRPPTADVLPSFRHGVPALGITNLMCHSTEDEGLGSTHATHRLNRFLLDSANPYATNLGY